MSVSPDIAVVSAGVGYKAPPVEHQFRQGRSGNPRGRPRKTASPSTTADPMLSHNLSDLVMAEAIRPIQIRENGELIELPLIQAVIRSLGVKAVKGDYRAQVAVLSAVKAVQDKTIADRFDLFKTVLEYKDRWEQAFQDCDARGLPRPDPVPHPHEMRVDHRTLEVKYNGPETIDEKARWDRGASMRADALNELAALKDELAQETCPETRLILEQDIERESRMVELITTAFPDEKTRRDPDFDLKEWRDRR